MNFYHKNTINLNIFHFVRIVIWVNFSKSTLRLEQYLMFANTDDGLC